MPAIDLKRELKELYNPSAKEPVLVDVPSMNFLMIDGHGDPNTSQEYANAMEALYAMAYGLKFMLKRGTDAVDYVVMPSEGLWWVDDLATLDMQDKSNWNWTMMIMQPEQVTAEMVAEASAQAGRKKDLPSLARLRFESYHEGLSAQIMHIGPYSAEWPTVNRLHEFIHAHGCQISGKHHEIYLGDPRKTAPEKLRTIIRYPVARN